MLVRTPSVAAHTDSAQAAACDEAEEPPLGEAVPPESSDELHPWRISSGTIADAQITIRSRRHIQSPYRCRERQSQCPPHAARHAAAAARSELLDHPACPGTSCCESAPMPASAMPPVGASSSSRSAIGHRQNRGIPASRVFTVDALLGLGAVSASHACRARLTGLTRRTTRRLRWSPADERDDATPISPAASQPCLGR